MWRSVYRRLLPFLVSGLLFAVDTVPKAYAQQSPSTVGVLQTEELKDLAARVLQRADKAGCEAGQCTILVVNFIGPTGTTSKLGMQLADTVAEQLAATALNIRVADRKRLQEYLEKERIPSKSLDEDNAARWLAIEQSANAVLVGHLAGQRGKLSLRLQLLDAHHLVASAKERRNALISPSEEAALTMTDQAGEIGSAEPFSANPDPPGSTSLQFLPCVQSSCTAEGAWTRHSVL